MTEIQSY